MKFLIPAVFFLSAFSLADFVDAAESAVPEPFRGFDPESEMTIKYDALSQWLDYLVVDIGRSNRQTAHFRPQIGTRITPRVDKHTLYEGNRFFYESFENNEDALQVLLDIRKSLEQIPSIAPLESYSRNEQLAYWLNLYNVTVLNEIARVYPTRQLEELLIGEDSILARKLVTVAGIPLSLNDIQFTILMENHDRDPLIMYGLYQGNIGGPNIRKEAYTGENVYRALESNAREFINSNRGTNRVDRKNKVRKVSSLYARNAAYFPDFNADLTAHLLKYVETGGKALAKSRKPLEPVITDWTVTDLWGTFPAIRTGTYANPAIMMGAIVSTTLGGADYAPGGILSASTGAAGTDMIGMAKLPVAMSPEVFQYLLVLNTKRLDTNEKKATVTIEELGEVAVEDQSEAPED